MPQFNNTYAVENMSTKSIDLNLPAKALEGSLSRYLTQIKKYDVLVFTAKCNEIHLNNPNAYTWVRNGKEGTLEISCKKPFNEKPVDEKPIVGTFFFKKSEFFINSINLLFKKKIK